MSRRAAARLESLWFRERLRLCPRQTRLARVRASCGRLIDNSPTAGRAALRDVPVCGQLETLAEVRSRIQKAGWLKCVVADAQRKVLGLIAGGICQANNALPAEQVMDPAPLTFRPHTTLEAVADRMQKQEKELALVTNPDGKLIGLLRQESK